MAIVGYARVSTEEQNLDLQMDALKAAGCERIFEDLGCSAIAERPGFGAALATLRAGDTFVIWKMDRAFRSLLHALETLKLFEARSVTFLSITEHIETSTPTGRFNYQVRNAFGELERALISERTKAGMAAARRRGKTLGRRRLLSDEQIAWAHEVLRTNRDMTLARLARELGVSSATLRRALALGRASHS